MAYSHFNFLSTIFYFVQGTVGGRQRPLQSYKSWLGGQTHFWFMQTLPPLQAGLQRVASGQPQQSTFL